MNEQFGTPFREWRAYTAIISSESQHSQRRDAHAAFQHSLLGLLCGFVDPVTSHKVGAYLLGGGAARAVTWQLLSKPSLGCTTMF